MNAMGRKCLRSKFAWVCEWWEHVGLVLGIFYSWTLESNSFSLTQLLSYGKCYITAVKLHY